MIEDEREWPIGAEAIVAETYGFGERLTVLRSTKTMVFFRERVWLDGTPKKYRKHGLFAHEITQSYFAERVVLIHDKIADRVAAHDAKVAAKDLSEAICGLSGSAAAAFRDDLHALLQRALFALEGRRD